jgi:hypothetical protein
MSADFFKALRGPFRSDQISWRIGSTSDKNPERPVGMALAYIDARDVMDRLDDVCGPENWQDRYFETAKGRMMCTLALRIEGEWVEKSDGAGDSDVESEKGAISDSLKRAAVKWGIGRYLYQLDSPWVAIEKRGKTSFMKDGERAKLDAAHANYVKHSFKNAAPSDAGQRETPKSQQKAGAVVTPTDAAPANELDGEEVDQTTQPEWPILEAEMEAFSTREDLADWWLSPEKKALKQRKPHMMKKFFQFAYAPRREALGETQVWEDEAGVRG